jgi:glyoxylase-like metal-dependent hydrolase (beta-lactamase superfamily II)
MIRGNELIQVPPRYAVWHGYDRAVKAELFSTVIATNAGLVVIDPILLRECAHAELTEMGRIVAVLVTNGNHLRAASNVDAPVFAPAEAHITGAELLSDDCRIHGIRPIAISGAGPGEFAFYDPRDRGAVVMGDALINFGEQGFALLPPKYCRDQKQMVRSLRRLLDLPFTRMFFAHGEPIITRPRERLRALLENAR